MTNKEMIVNRIKHLIEKMKNTESTFFKHLYFVEIKNLEEGLKILRLKEIDQELNEIGNPENDYQHFIELLQEENDWRGNNERCDEF